MPNNYKGIPAADRKRVRSLVLLHAASETPKSPQAVYKSLVEGREAKAREEAANAARVKKANRRYQRETARDGAKKAIESLLIAWQLAQAIEDGQDLSPTLDHHDAAQFIRMAIGEAGAKLEKALVTFDVLKPDQADAFRE